MSGVKAKKDIIDELLDAPDKAICLAWIVAIVALAVYLAL